MKKSAWIIIAVLAVIVIAAAIYFLRAPAAIEKAGADAGQGTVAGEGAIIAIKNLNFNPSKANINAGEKITWKNEDSFLHDVTIDRGLFDVDIEPGKSFTYVFNESGTYNYHCDIHPSMKGTIVVS